MAGPWCLVAASDWLTGAMPPLMFPVVADLGRGRVADKEMPSGATRPGSPPRPQVRSRAAGQIKEGRAVRCHAMAMSRSPSRHTLDGAMVRVRVLDADMTAVALRDPRKRKRVRPVESHPPSDPSGILRAANPGAQEPSMANALACHCQTSGRLLPAGELGWCAQVPFSRARQTRMGEASLVLSDGLSGVSREQLLGSSPAAADLDFDAGGHQGGQEGRRPGVRPSPCRLGGGMAKDWSRAAQGLGHAWLTSCDVQRPCWCARAVVAAGLALSSNHDSSESGIKHNSMAGPAGSDDAVVAKTLGSENWQKWGANR